MNINAFDFDDPEDRRRFTADVLDRFESAEEPLPFNGENGRDAGRYGSTWARYTSPEPLSVRLALAVAVVAVAVVLIVKWSAGLSAGPLFALLALTVVVPFLVYVVDVTAHRSRRSNAERSLERAKVTGEELVILHELYENFHDDYSAGTRIARRRASLRRIQRARPLSSGSSRSSKDNDRSKA